MEYVCGENIKFHPIILPCIRGKSRLSAELAERFCPIPSLLGGNLGEKHSAGRSLPYYNAFFAYDKFIRSVYLLCVAQNRNLYGNSGNLFSFYWAKSPVIG